MESLTIKEQLALASLIEKNGNNWQIISKMIKAYAEPGRPNDWLNPKQCSQEYEQLTSLVDVIDIQRRKRNGENITCEYEIIKILTEKRQEELMLFIEEETKKYLKLKQDIYLLENDQLDYNQLENMLQDMELQEKTLNIQKPYQDNPANNIFENMLRNSLSADEGANNLMTTNVTYGNQQVDLDSEPKDIVEDHLSGGEDDEMEDDGGMSLNILNALNKVEQDVVEMQDRERLEREAKSAPITPTMGSPVEFVPPIIIPTVNIVEARVDDKKIPEIENTTPTLNPSPTRKLSPNPTLMASPLKKSPSPSKKEEISPSTLSPNVSQIAVEKENLESLNSPVSPNLALEPEPCGAIIEQQQPLVHDENSIVKAPDSQLSNISTPADNIKPKRGRKKKLKTSSTSVANEIKTDTESEITMDSQSDQVPMDSSNLEDKIDFKDEIESKEDGKSAQLNEESIAELNAKNFAKMMEHLKTATRINNLAPKNDLNSPNKAKQPLVHDSKRFELHSPEHKTWKRSIMLLHSRLCSHNWSDNFFHPITDQIAPCYSSIIHYPVDLGTLKKWVESGSVRTTGEYRRWVMLMFQNALMYNSEDHVIYKMTRETYKDALKNIQEYVVASSGDKSSNTPTPQPSHPEGAGTALKRRDKSPMTGKTTDLQANEGKDQTAQQSPIVTRINIRNRISTRQKRNSNLDNRSEDSKSPR